MEKTVANKNIFDKDFILLDGAMGTMLQQKGMELGTVPETLNITKPDWIIDIHKRMLFTPILLVQIDTKWLIRDIQLMN